MSFFDDHEDDIVFGRQRDRDDFDDLDYLPRDTCRYCRTTGLHWGVHDGRHRLMTNRDVPHNCPQAQPTPEGFDDVD